MTAEDEKIGLSTLLFFGAGGVAMGLLNLGIAFFALLYYNNALGVSATVVGSALAIALILDAFSDPLVGAWSDRVTTRWGRRHPFMYASILPSTLFFYLFWHPPEWALASDTSAFWFLLIVIAAVRISATFYDVPSVALIPELTTDYDRRSDLLNYHANLYYMSTAGAMVLVYGFALADTADSQGILHVEGYQDAGLIGAIIIAVTMLVSAAGLHRHIPRLHRPEIPSQDATPMRWTRHFAPLANISLLAILLSMFFSAAMHGTFLGLWGYIMSYFWGLSSSEIATLSFVAVLGTPIAFVVVPWLFHGREKRRVAVAVLIVGIFLDVGPIVARLLGLLPGNESPWIAWMIYVQAVFQTVTATLIAVGTGSMLAEVVEAHAVKTGDHVAGLISSTRSFTRKATNALGTAIAGWLLVRVQFPTGRETADVPGEIVHNLGLHYAPLAFVLACLTIAALFAYRITREDHERNVAELELRSSES